MDDITLLQTLISILLAIIFTAFAVNGVSFSEEEGHIAPTTTIWCMLAGICWYAFAFISIALTTTTFFYSFSYMLFAVGFIFFPVLTFYTLFLSIKQAAEVRREKESSMELYNEPW